MGCKPIRLKNGATALVNVARGKKITESDLKTLEEYAEYCRARAAERQRQRNAALLPGGDKRGGL